MGVLSVQNLSSLPLIMALASHEPTASSFHVETRNRNRDQGSSASISSRKLGQAPPWRGHATAVGPSFCTSAQGLMPHHTLGMAQQSQEKQSRGRRNTGTAAQDHELTRAVFDPCTDSDTALKLVLYTSTETSERAETLPHATETSERAETLPHARSDARCCFLHGF